MSNEKRKRWKVWCLTEDTYVEEWRRHTDPIPTECPSNPGHSIDSSLTAIEETQNALIVEKTSDPSINDDFLAGYNIGSHWTNITADTEWICVDDINGAAIWKKLNRVILADLIDDFLLDNNGDIVVDQDFKILLET